MMVYRTGMNWILIWILIHHDMLDVIGRFAQTID